MVPAKPPMPNIEPALKQQKQKSPKLTLDWMKNKKNKKNNEPIQASSSIRTRPEGSGESSESYEMKTCAIHPMDIAYPTVPKFAEKF